MPVVLRGPRSDYGPLPGADVVASSRLNGGRAQMTHTIEIGLINNMPDAALQATERQFIELLDAAAGEFTVRMHFLSLPQVPRGDTVASHLQATYADMGELAAGRLDALIVTGTEPRAASLDQEPYWDSLTEIIDWAEHNTISTIWSCLAAHAAVLHLDGVRRHTLREKRFGVFACTPISDDPLLSGMPTPLSIPHARCNELKESELVSHGYRVLTRSSEAGVDMFVKQWRSLFVFFQGHPEYDVDSLLREYRRDIGRFLRGESESCPPIPKNYFDARSESALLAFEAGGRADRSPEMLASFPDDLVIRSELVRNWRASAIPVIRNWLFYLASRKS
ncbi:homoserine O-succinyltransferase [Rhizobiales bacterium GAS191]|nr:homoserine O-succinyltransferase [Rhizobiales bacterium GAS191]